MISDIPPIREQPMQLRPTAVALTTALTLGLAAVPLSGTASAHSAPASCAARVSPSSPSSATDGSDTAALCAAIAGLPDHDATAALIRVGGAGS
jgi:D-alanyl-D-alanine carboxypeptidase